MAGWQSGLLAGVPKGGADGAHGGIQFGSLIVEQMKVSERVTEELKAADQMAWVGAMNSIRNRAEEIILRELIYGEDAV